MKAAAQRGVCLWCWRGRRLSSSSLGFRTSLRPLLWVHDSCSFKPNMSRHLFSHQTGDNSGLILGIYSHLPISSAPYTLNLIYFGISSTVPPSIVAFMLAGCHTSLFILCLTVYRVLQTSKQFSFHSVKSFSPLLLRCSGPSFYLGVKEGNTVAGVGHLPPSGLYHQFIMCAAYPRFMNILSCLT